MVSPQTVFTYPFHHAKLQILPHCVTANSLYLSFSLCKATNLTTWCHRKQSLLILFTMQSYKSYYMVSPQTVFTYPFHHAKLQILLCGVTANSLYLSFSLCKTTNLTTWCHRKQTLPIIFTVQSYKSYYMVSPQTVFTYPFHHAKLQILPHGVTANSLYLSFSPCKATNLTTWCHRKQSLLILFTVQSYKSYYMVSPQTDFTYPFHHAKLQILPHGVTANSLYLSFSPCKATNLTTWCHRKQSLLILFIVQSYKSYYMVSPQTVFTYPFHRAKLQILLHGVTANSLYLSFSPCKATNLTTWCHRKQSLLILFIVQSYKYYYMVSPVLILFTMQSYKCYYVVSPQTVFTYPFHHAKLQMLLHGVTANSLYLSFSLCKTTNLTTWCHRKQTLPIIFTVQSYKSYYMVSPQTVFTYPFHCAKLQILQHGVTANSHYLSFSLCKTTNLTTWCHRKQTLPIIFTVQNYKSYYMVSPQTDYLSFSPCKATNLTTWCHRKQSLLILFTVQSYKSYYMVSPQTVITYPFHCAKLQILLHGVTANRLYLSFSPCKATNLTTWCHRKQTLPIIFTVQSYKSYYMVSPQTDFTYHFHRAKLQILLHGVTANRLYLSFSPCKATNLTTWCHRKQTLPIIFTVQSYKSYYMVSPQTDFTYHFHRAKLQILLHGVTANRLYLSFSPCKATNLTTWCHRKQTLPIIFTVQSYKSYYMVSPQTDFTYHFHRAKLQILLHGVTANRLYLSFSPCKATNLTTWCHRKQTLPIIFTVQSYKSYFPDLSS